MCVNLQSIDEYVKQSLFRAAMSCFQIRIFMFPKYSEILEIRLKEILLVLKIFCPQIWRYNNESTSQMKFNYPDHLQMQLIAI
jgi:hypothetical protein